MFSPVPELNLPRLQEEILTWWEQQKTFEKSVALHKHREAVFYDGPPFPTGAPHHGTVLVSVLKDFVARYLTMRGYSVPRVWGWDCHGLPIETQAEKQCGIRTKTEIEGKLGVARFNQVCRSIVQNHNEAWRSYIRQMARWVDYDNSYRTMDRSYMESVLWVFKQCYDKGLVYRDYRVTPYCMRCETSLSLSDIRESDATRPRQDPSVVVRFRLNRDFLGKPAYALAWTTTPWTLPSNLALAVHTDFDYALVEVGDAVYILAEARIPVHQKILGEMPAVKSTIKGRELVGERYEPLLPYFSARKEDGVSFQVLAADFVDLSEGTGIVHIAPAFGEDDYFLCKQAGIRVANPVDEHGCFTAVVADFAGRSVLEANLDIVRLLRSRQQLLDDQTVLHNYPHCWRCAEPVIYRAMDAWYLSVTQLKDALLRENKNIHWIPESVQDGRFGKWLENARDWNISRNRYWGTPLPMWICSSCGAQEVLGSVAEIEARWHQPISDLHKETVDQVTFHCPCGGVFSRTPEVLDCWFESGAMPFGQRHYPFENKEWFEAHFPADFIIEYVGQLRAWFYYLHVLAVALTGRPAFRNCVVHGTILSKDGKKISKSKKNYTDPMELMQEQGTDALRLYLLQSPAAVQGDLLFDDSGPQTMLRQALLPLWNAYSFLVSYANIDGWRPSGDRVGASSNPLDRWILARLHEVHRKVTEAMDNYQVDKPVPVFVEFIDDLTNWYLRRSRRRFWEGDPDDKRNAYATLHFVLTQLARMLAPASPVIAEGMYRNLVDAESVHLEPWPEIPDELADERLLKVTNTTRRIIRLALALRAQHAIKVRQPLARMEFALPDEMRSFFDKDQAPIIAEEVNVKSVALTADASAIADVRYVPDFRQLGPKLGAEMKLVNEGLRAGNVRVERDRVIVAHAGREWNLGRDEVKVIFAGRDNRVVEGEGGVIVSLDTCLTNELIEEGVAREVVRQIQDMRKEADYSITDRIDLDIVGQVPDSWVPYIAGETLAVIGAVAEPDAERVVEVSAGEVKIRIRRSRTNTD